MNRYLVRNGNTRDLILYWYQTPRRVVAGEWSAKLWLVADAMRDRRTDTALVRVVVPLVGEGEATADEIATSFTKTFYPVVRQALPR